MYVSPLLPAESQKAAQLFKVLSYHLNLGYRVKMKADVRKDDNRAGFAVRCEIGTPSLGVYLSILRDTTSTSENYAVSVNEGDGGTFRLAADMQKEVHAFYIGKLVERWLEVYNEISDALETEYQTIA